MSIYRGRYYGASGCDSGAEPGTRALMSWFLGAYGDRGAANLGTYACKRLGSGWSIHAERRAADMGTSPYGGVDSPWGWKLANAIRRNSAELGVQLIILGDRIWSCVYPDAGWRDYGGAYHGHAHVELIPDAARNLTAAEIEDVIGGGWSVFCKRGDSGKNVELAQRKLKYVLPRFYDGAIDGIYGRKMAAAVRKLREAGGLDAGDGNDYGPQEVTQTDEQIAEHKAARQGDQVAREVKKATDKAIADLVANLPSTGADVPSHIVLDLPDEIRVPVEPAEDDEG